MRAGETRSACRPMSKRPTRRSEERSRRYRSPQRLAREPRAFDEAFEFCPHDRGMDASVERSLRETAIGARDHVLASESVGVARDPLGNELGMLDDIRRVADGARDEGAAWRQLHVLPYCPFVLVARIGALDQIS